MYQVLAVLIGITWTLAYIWFRIAFRERLALASKIPGFPVYPVIGSLYLIRESASEFFSSCEEKSRAFPEKITKVMWMHRVAVAVWNAEDVEVILSSNTVLEKSSEYRFFKPWLGNGLLISSGETWRHHRRLIAPTFHANVLKQFVYLFNRNSVALCEKLDKMLAQTIDIHDYMSETTVEILLETAMGVDRSTQKNGYDYAIAVMKLCGILHRRHFRPWLWPDSLFSLFPEGRLQKKLLGIVHGLTHEVLKKRKEERKVGVREGLYKRLVDHEEDGHTTVINEESSYDQSSGLRDDLDDVGEKKRIAFLDQMLDAAEGGVVLTDQEVEDQVNTIMFEGHDTTAAASSFFLAILGTHPEIQDKCVHELWEIFGDADPAVRPATFKDTLQMKYLERCILETLRLFPPVPIVARKLNENLKFKTGYVAPKESTVVVATFLLHRDPQVFPNPTVFNPDNFLPERCVSRHYYAFVPFSAGPRSCVGRKYAMLKLKILLSTLLRKFQVRADVKPADFQLMGDIILKRKEGFPVRLYQRTMPSAPST